ncbi:MAG: histidine--tRNA ligase [Chloroflexi bacterium]|nr:histidine--tRNA ligase [Chloroflexota bacterium]
MYQSPRGTTDILPPEQPYWYFIEQKAIEISRLYGYERIETPVFEDTGLFTRGVGEATDIVQKEMYSFDDKGGNNITLKPEGTAPVCRAYLERGMHNLPQPVKLCYMTPIFRYERPQAGRLRQHHQFGCEAIGEDDPLLDAEIIDIAWKLFASLGLKKLTVKLNSIGDKQCRPQYLAVLKEYYSKHVDELCPDCKVRLQRNPLRLLDCKKETCQEIAKAAPQSVNFLCPECDDHFASVKKYLGLLNIPFEIDSRLVRGLDYYTRTVFEVQPEGGGAQSTIGGGGRYDDLIEQLGGKHTPALGFGTGIERIVLNLKKQGVAIPPPPKPDIFIAYMGDPARELALQLADVIRKAGTGVIVSTGRSLKAQLRQANSLGVSQTLILGEDEVKTRTVTVRDMATSQQKCVSFADLPDALNVADKEAWAVGLTSLRSS